MTNTTPETPGIPGSVEEELAAQAGWKLLPRYEGLGLFDDLARAEFFDPERLATLADQAVSSMARFAAQQVPYYRDFFERSGISPGSIRTVADLRHLPVLSKEKVIEFEKQLHAENLPANEIANWTTYSSGTTGKRTRVRMTHRANMMFTILALRQYRWFRFDLSGKLASILAPRNFAHPEDENPPMDYQADEEAWPYASTFFETGPVHHMSSATTLEARHAWLEQRQPDYLISNPGILEEHAFMVEEGPYLRSLKGAVGIAAQMSDGMRRRIERSFGVPIDQNYGANEIGIIAVRCRAGRYHVQQEHCVVEICDRDGTPVGTGERGRILVTGLSNLAMPLFRYELGDWASVPDGPCPCGRTLPSFENIEGRYRRWIHVPPDSYRKFWEIATSFEAVDPQYTTTVRAYQVHLYRDKRFELRIASPAALPAIVSEQVLKAWRNRYPELPDGLAVTRVDAFEVPPNGKVPDFTTDFPDRPYTEAE